MVKKHTVALIYGGRGWEREVSLSGMKNILPLIDEEGFSLLPIHIHPDGRWTLHDKEILLTQGGIIYEGKFRKIDCSFPLLHGDFGEDGRVQGALDCADIPYIGCDAVAGAICRDKFVVKAVADSLSIPTLPAFLAVRTADTRKIIALAEEKIGYPAFVKPTSLGSSYGAGRANDRRELFMALKNAFRLSERLLIEKALTDKRELECGFLSVKGKELFTNPGEILVDGTYDYNKKYMPGKTQIRTVAEVEPNIAERIKEYSKMLVRVLGVRDFSRIDFFLSGEELYFNEINTIPGMTATSLYPKMIEESDITLKNALSLLIEARISSR